MENVEFPPMIHKESENIVEQRDIKKKTKILNTGTIASEKAKQAFAWSIFAVISKVDTYDLVVAVFPFQFPKQLSSAKCTTKCTQ